MVDLFTSYPHRAGAKENTTSREAAQRIERSGRAEALRQRALYVLRHEPMTDKELAAALGEDINSVRPRRTELFKQGLVEQTGERREHQHVWAGL